MKKAWILFVIFLLMGCATPATVKQAVKKQSEAYTELQEGLRAFNQSYIDLNEHLFRLNQESRSRIEALSMVRGLSGLDPSLQVGDLKTYAQVNREQVDEVATKLDSVPPSRMELLKAFNKSIRLLEKAFGHGETESKKEIQKIRKTLREEKASHGNAMKEIRALIVIHDTVGEYLEIDLTPESKALKEAITNIKALKK